MAWKTCEYVHPTGRQCNGPAMRDTSFCYHHRRRQLKPAAAYIPPLSDPYKVQVALTEVLRGILTNRISEKEGGKILYGIQTAIVMERKKPKYSKSKRGGEEPTTKNQEPAMR